MYYCCFFGRTTTERARRCSSIPRQKPNRFNRSSDAPNKSPSNFDSLPLRKFSQNATLPRSNYTQPQRGFSLDRRREPKEAVEIEMDPMLLVNTPILCNKYVVGKNDGFTGKIPGKGKHTPISFFFKCWSDVVCCSAHFLALAEANRKKSRRSA